MHLPKLRGSGYPQEDPIRSEDPIRNWNQQRSMSTCHELEKVDLNSAVDVPKGWTSGPGLSLVKKWNPARTCELKKNSSFDSPMQPAHELQCAASSVAKTSPCHKGEGGWGRVLNSISLVFPIAKWNHTWNSIGQSLPQFHFLGIGDAKTCRSLNDLLCPHGFRKSRNPVLQASSSLSSAKSGSKGKHSRNKRGVLTVRVPQRDSTDSAKSTFRCPVDRQTASLGVPAIFLEYGQCDSNDQHSQCERANYLGGIP